MKTLSCYPLIVFFALASAVGNATTVTVQILPNFNQTGALNDVVHLGDNRNDARFIPPNPSGTTLSLQFQLSAIPPLNSAPQIKIDQYQADNSVPEQRSFVKINGVFAGFFSLNPAIQTLTGATQIPVVTDTFSIDPTLLVQGVNTVTIITGDVGIGPPDTYDDFCVTNLRFVYSVQNSPSIKIDMLTASDAASSLSDVHFCSADLIHCEATTANASGLTVAWKVEPDSLFVGFTPVFGGFATALDFYLVPLAWADPYNARPSSTMGFWLTARLMDGNIEKASDRIHINQSGLGQLRQEYVDHAVRRVIPIPKVSEFTDRYPRTSDGWNTGDYRWSIIPAWAVGANAGVNFAAAGVIPDAFLPLQVNCVYRNPVHNTNLKGSVSNSLHMFGLAIDFQVKDWAKPLKNINKADWSLLADLCVSPSLGFEIEPWAESKTRSSPGSGSRHVHIEP